jgi:transcriptional regulator with XRE-family HTH domain
VRRDKTQVSDTFAAVVQRMMNQRGMSARALSRAAGLANSYVTQILNGDRGKRPTADSVLALGQALSASPAELAELLEVAGHPFETDPGRPAFEQFVMGDRFLRYDQKRALIAQYRTYVRS